MEKELLYKSRSFSSCIKAAYQLMSKNMWNLIKATWLPVLLYAILLGALLLLNLPNEEVVAMGTAHFALYIGLLAAGLLGFIAAGIWAFSRLMSILNEEPRRWNFSRAVWLTLNSIVITGVITAVVIGLGKLVLPRLAHTAESHFWLFLGVSVVLLALFCVLLLPFAYVYMKYMNEKGMRFWHDLTGNYRTGLRRVSFIFITLFISGLIVMILTVIVMLPYFTLTSAYYTSLMGYLMGDPSDLPGYFPVLYFITATAVHFLLWYVGAFMVIVIFFMYGSIEKRLEEQRDAHLEETEQPVVLPSSLTNDIPQINLQP